MERFELDALPIRVVFGAGRVDDLGAEAERLGAVRAALVGGRDGALRARVAAALGDRLAGRVEQTRQHVPEEVAEAARTRVAELRADALVAIGGGSAIGVAKAVALTTGLPILAVPTTYSGSEMTPVWGITAGGRKTTGTDARVLPRTVVYDPELTVGLPPALSAASGLNAMAHCAEALWVPRANPVTSALASEGIRALAAGLPRVVARPEDVEARAGALLGAYLAGSVLGAVGTGLHHKLAHVLGGTFDLPHAEVHAVLLPYTIAFHVRRAPAAVARIGRALDVSDPAGAVWDLGRELGTPRSLAELGMTPADAERAADVAAESGAVTRDEAFGIFEQAMTGAAPARHVA